MKKMNKKGFTLVELLAVIVILALIMAIAVVSMSGIMTGARQNTMKETGLQIINGVRNQLTLANELIASDPKFSGNGQDYYVSADLLEKGGKTAPLGGDYLFAGSSDGEQVGSIKGVYRAASAVTCNGENKTFVRVKHDGTNWVWSICLTAGKTGDKVNPYINMGTETALLGNTTDMIVTGPTPTPAP